MAETPSLYGSFGSVPDVVSPPSGSGAEYQHPTPPHASPEDFGGQIGDAQQKEGSAAVTLGDKAQQMGIQFASMATEAKVNDDFANKYAPAAAQLRSQYDLLEGQDKIHGYDDYIKGLKNLNQQMVGNEGSSYGQQLLGGLIDHHISTEIDGAKRELVESQKDFSAKANLDLMKSDNNWAGDNYNDPRIAATVSQRNDARITMQAIDNGVDPNTDHGQQYIQDQQRDMRGTMAVGMIDRAVNSGDVAAAAQIRADYSKAIPGYQQNAIDSVIFTQSMRQSTLYGMAALKNGQPLSNVVGAPPSHVQATVANVAHNNGVDPNAALTVSWIESRNGQNVGSRGDIDQTGKPAATLEEQSQNMIDAMKGAKTVATNTLGRDPENWETYLCYQQDSGGGPALLKAASNPNTLAVDALKPLYPTQKAAIAAIVDNGGNTSMSAADFASMIKKNYTQAESHASCDFSAPEGQTMSPGEMIQAPHQYGGQVVQPAATPKQQLIEYENKLPNLIQRINAIPNVEWRGRMLKALDSDYAQYKGASGAYTQTLVNSSEQIMAKPDFNLDRDIPPEMQATLAADHPETLMTMQARSDRIAAKGGGVDKDDKEYGAGMFPLMRAINTNKVTTIGQLMDHLPKSNGEPGDITYAGFEKLKTLLAKDPESASDTAMQTQAFKVIRRQLSGKDDDLNIPDPKGEELFSRAMPILYKAIDDGRATGLSMGEMTDPGNKAWIGNKVKALQRSPEQMALDMGADATQLTQSPQQKRLLSDIMNDYNNTDDPKARDALKAEAIKLGYVRADDRHEVPASGVQ